MQVDVENGKYSFVTMSDDWRIHVWRFGEPWVIIDLAPKAIIVMMGELERAREEISLLKQKPST